MICIFWYDMYLLTHMVCYLYLNTCGMRKSGAVSVQIDKNLEAWRRYDKGTGVDESCSVFETTMPKSSMSLSDRSQTQRSDALPSASSGRMVFESMLHLHKRVGCVQKRLDTRRKCRRDVHVCDTQCVTRG